MALLLASTHDLAHVLVGRLLGIRFVAFYAAGVRRPQPGVKLDYASYLKVSPLARTLMHASGAVVTKLVPLVVLAVARRERTAGWVKAILAVLAVAQIATDAIFSTRFSDWKRVRRQVGLMRNPEGRSENPEVRIQKTEPGAGFPDELKRIT
jgi:hypothetical protein